MSGAAAGQGLRILRSLSAVAAALVMLPLRLPGPVAVATLAIAFAWLPGALLMSRLRALADPAERALGSIALSPALVAGAASALIVAGVAPVLAARFLAAMLFLGAVAAALWPGDLRDAPGAAAPSGAPEATGRKNMSTQVAPAILWALIVLAFLAGNPWLPPRSDGWFHAGVAAQIARRGLPVEDPSFAGLRLLYFWGTDLWAALWIARDPAIAVWTPLIALNVAAAFAVLLAVAAMARRLGAGRGGQWLACGLAALGYAPFAWGWVAARAAGGAVRGVAELERLIGSGADTALRALGVGQLHASLATFADKFLVLTPFGLGLALFALFLIALRDAADTGALRSFALLALVTAAALFTHTVAGLSALAVVAAWCAIGLIRGGGSRRAAPRVAMAVAAGTLLAVPYLLAVTRGKHAGLAPGLSREAVGSLLLGGALLVPAGVRGALRTARERTFATDLLIAMGVLALLGLALKLPESNQAKFFNLLFLIAAPAAAVALGALWERCSTPARAAVSGALAVALLPTAMLWAWGFGAERGQSLDSWRPPSPEVAVAWTWLAASTPRDCVVADAGGAREPMVFAARSAIAPGASLERDWGYPAASLSLRRRALRELSARGPVSAGTDSLIRSLGRELVVVERRAGAPGDLPRLRLARPDSVDATPPARAVRVRYTLLREAGAIAFWRAEPRP